MLRSHRRAVPAIHVIVAMGRALPAILVAHGAALCFGRIRWAVPAIHVIVAVGRAVPAILGAHGAPYVQS